MNKDTSMKIQQLKAVYEFQKKKEKKAKKLKAQLKQSHSQTDFIKRRKKPFSLMSETINTSLLFQDASVDYMDTSFVKKEKSMFLKTFYATQSRQNTQHTQSGTQHQNRLSTS